MAPFCLTQKFGARIIIEGAHIGEAKTYAETLVEKEKLTYVNGYDDPSIIAGAGTMGMEVSSVGVACALFSVEVSHFFLYSR
jgi:threonine dehydratase